MGQSCEKLLGLAGWMPGNLVLGGGVVGCALIQGWAPINFFYLQGGGLFEVGAYSKLGA